MRLSDRRILRLPEGSRVGALEVIHKIEKSSLQDRKEQDGQHPHWHHHWLRSDASPTGYFFVAEDNNGHPFLFQSQPPDGRASMEFVLCDENGERLCKWYSKISWDRTLRRLKRLLDF